MHGPRAGRRDTILDGPEVAASSGDRAASDVMD
jgi:hypothetical protein